MSDSPFATLITLKRWREFREKIAETEYQASTAGAALARAEYDHACQVVVQVQERRAAQLAGVNLDLDRMQLYSRMEIAAQDRSADRERALGRADEAANAALEAYSEARAATRVVAERLERYGLAADQRSEKRVFDQVSELYTRTGRSSHDRQA